MIDAKCKKCRRAGEKLFLKGERCFSSKCAMVRNSLPPGPNIRKNRRGGFSEYGKQMKEKQRLRIFYGLREKQFSNYVHKALAKKDVDKSEFLVRNLETRLDNVIYRAGFTSSSRQARQIISHGNILVNARRVDIPSYQVEIGDTIEPKKKARIIERVKECLSAKTAEAKELPGWFSLDKKDLVIKISAEPSPKDLPQDFDTSSIVEFYSR